MSRRSFDSVSDFDQVDDRELGFTLRPDFAGEFSESVCWPHQASTLLRAERVA